MKYHSACFRKRHENALAILDFQHPASQPEPAAPSSLGQVLAIVQAVVAIVPRWLVVAAGVVFVSWLGFELYLKARQEVARTQQIEGDVNGITKSFREMSDETRDTDRARLRNPAQVEADETAEKQLRERLAKQKAQATQSTDTPRSPLGCLELNCK